MTPTMTAILGFLAMLGLIGLRMPIGLAMLVTGSFGYIHFTGWPVFLNYLKTTPYFNFANYTLSVIPLFILMGAFAEKSGLSRDLFKAAAAMVGHRRGGLSMGVIWACTAFGAICGSSVATTATFGRAALPELKRFGYEPGHATGTIAVGGTLGILIPPSVILVVYAISTEQNIVKLFAAALIPGILAAVFYTVVVALFARANPQAVPALPPATPREKLAALRAVWPVMVVAVVVVGGIYGGVFTPTQGASVGAAAVLVIALLRGSLSRRDFFEALAQTAETSGMIFLILLGADVFNAFLAQSQLPTTAAEAIAGAGWSPHVVMAALLLFYILLGAVMDELAMILLTLPVFFPIVTALDFGLPSDEVAIWFGILVLIVVGIGLTAPPIGLNVFVVSAIAREVPIARTYRGVLPYLASDVVRLFLVLAFPSLSLWLVRLID